MKSLILTGVLDPSDLALIIKECEPHFDDQFRQGEVVSGLMPNIRTSGVRFIETGIPETVQIGFELLYKTIGDYKFECYNYPDIQFLKYPAGGFYNWHYDHMKQRDSDMERAMSLSITLNDDFEGGGLDIKDGYDLLAAPNVKGGFAMFSAFHQHRAVPVTAGERRAITMWFPSDPETVRKICGQVREGSMDSPLVKLSA